MKKRIILIFLIMVFVSNAAFSIDIWQYPESAERSTIFVGALAASLTFSFSDPRDFRFNLFIPEFYIDYVLPAGLPFSIGGSIRPLTPEIFALGLRPAYHINFDVPNLNVYVMYAVHFGITNDFVVIEYGACIGVRYLIYSIFCLTAETSPRMKSIRFGLVLKLN